jgi:transcriptional regulator with XRE-family HTH domain
MSLQLSGRLIAAARPLTGISHAEFADAAGLHLSALQQMEAGGSARMTTKRQSTEMCYE